MCAFGFEQCLVKLVDCVSEGALLSDTQKQSLGRGLAAMNPPLVNASQKSHAGCYTGGWQQ
jgi:hypothetical protein